MPEYIHQKSAFVICPVREATDEERRFIEEYVSNLERGGYRVHYPKRDTKQEDLVGLQICLDNREAIRKSAEVHIYWNGKSSGSLFDLGMAFMADKPIILFNRDRVRRTERKSFENVLLKLDEEYRKRRV